MRRKFPSGAPVIPFGLSERSGREIPTERRRGFAAGTARPTGRVDLLVVVWRFPAFPTQRQRGDSHHPPQMASSVLVVDDDPVFRALAASVLADSGLTVVGEADTVSAALSAAARLKPTAALVDVGLPDGDGFALARQLTTLPWHPHVVVTSVDGDAGGADEVRRSGARAFIPKADLPNAPLARLLGAA